MKRPVLKATKRTIYWCGSQDATTVQDLIDACHNSRLDPDCVTVEYNSRYETEPDDDGILRSGIVGVAMTVNDADRRAYSLAREKYDAWAASDEGKAELKRREVESKKAEKNRRQELKRTVLRQKVLRALDDANLEALGSAAKALGVGT